MPTQIQTVFVQGSCKPVQPDGDSAAPRSNAVRTVGICKEAYPCGKPTNGSLRLEFPPPRKSCFPDWLLATLRKTRRQNKNFQDVSAEDKKNKQRTNPKHFTYFVPPLAKQATPFNTLGPYSCYPLQCNKHVETRVWTQLLRENSLYLIIRKQAFEFRDTNHNRYFQAARLGQSLSLHLYF